MRFQRIVALAFLTSVVGPCLFAQGLNTTAAKNDWEEINFEFNSHVLVDGYPSLLRLAELLQQNTGYKVKLEGHADFIGSNTYNERLGTRRAETVKSFLVKYGASAGQVSTATQGERAPKTPARSRDGRFMSRRVMMTLTDANGQVVLERSGVKEAINSLDALMAAQKKCCDDILKRLDKLDEIADMLRKIAGENDGLKKELADLRKAQSELDNYVKGMPKPLTSSETASIVDTRTAEQIEKARMPRFSIVGLNAGADGNGSLTFTGRGRYFAPFKEQFAVQAQGEYMYFRDRREAQIDFGLVNRFATRVQAGMFASFKHVNLVGGDGIRLSPFDGPGGVSSQSRVESVRGSGTLGQASFTLDYIFSRGKFGIFGSKGFLNDAVLNSVSLSRNVFDEFYLRTIDQAGLSTTVGLFKNVYMEGNLGYLKSRGYGNKAGGTARFVAPISDRFAFTLEGGMNETMLSYGNNGRVVAGFQFGNFMSPKDYLEGYNGIQHAVPVDIPRVRYEVLTRRVRTGGNEAPIADAGPDQIGVAAGNITLSGTGFDADGDPITYQWSQIAGPSVSISGMNQAQASFTAAEGQTYSFRLTVRDDKGGQGIARTTVTTTSQSQVQIARFQASPERIMAGQTSTIDWQVLNADSVTITEVGAVDARNGTRAVTPTRTTQYRLTARNRTSEATATTTVVVEEQPPAFFLACSATPTNIMVGESATINYATQNATEVSISGIGNVDPSGSRVVTPTETTNYTLTARNARGPVVCNVTVQVTAGAVPRVISFTATPTSITSGQSSTLRYQVENATEVTISGGIGAVQPNGQTDVRPTATTTYTLTARNRNGETTSTATVTVTPPVVVPGQVALAACSASPATSAKPGDPVVLSYTATNATGIAITPGVSNPSLTGPVTVSPLLDTTYTVTATGANNTTATCSIAVKVTPGGPPVPIIVPSEVETINRLITLDGSKSTDPAGGALTYIWTPISTGAAILDQGQVMTRAQLGGLFGDYVFQLTVRNPAGLESSTTVTVRYRGTRLN